MFQKEDPLKRNLRVIINAIDKREMVTFLYMGEKKMVEPFILGTNKETGKYLLRCYIPEQMAKYESSKNWELFELDKIEKLMITPVRAKIYRRGYNPEDPDMAEIIIAAPL